MHRAYHGRPRFAPRLCTCAQFTAAAKEGEVVHLAGKVLRSTRSLGFTEVTITSADGKLVATGRHTKFFPPPRK